MTTTTGPSPEIQPLIDLQRIVVAVRRQRRFWVSAGLLGLLAGLLIALLTPARPTATTRLLIVHEHDQSAAGATLMLTDIALLETTRIAGEALKRLGSDEKPEDFLATYKGTPLTGNVLELTVTGTDGADAIARAKALAEVFIADHVQRTQAGADANAKALLDQRDRAQAELAEVEAAIVAIPQAERRDNPAAVDTLYARRADLTSQVGQLSRRAEEAAVGAPQVAAGTQIVDAPRALPSSPLKTAVMYAGIGLLLGLTTGLGLSAISSVVRDRPTLRREIAADLGASVIAQLPAPRRGLVRLWLRLRRSRERQRVAATLLRAVGNGATVSLLELGTARVTAALAVEMAEGLAASGPVVIVDDLPRRNVRKQAGKRDGPIRVVDGADAAEGAAAQSRPAGPGESMIGVGSVAPGTAWTDVGRLGAETVLVVRTGYANAAWLHTVARQLADLQIPVVGVVLVDPDPRDRSDGTLWDGLHTALRGRNRLPTTAPAIPPTSATAAAPAAAALPATETDQPGAGNGLANAGVVSRDDYRGGRLTQVTPAADDVEVP